ncbi:MAG: stimulus-sensing domain-containing protein [Hyphomicrobium aestuarii]|nr:stimulus-sensing domain-containing protein [Hyphomicrobium aestuarii]
MALETGRTPLPPPLPERWAAALLRAAKSTGGWLLHAASPAAAGLSERTWAWVSSWWAIRWISATLLRRIVVTNLLSFVILVFGVLYLGASHSWLLEAKRDSLQKQGQIIAAAIGENVRADALPNITGGDVPTETARVPYRDDGFAALEFSLSPERVTPILNRIIRPTDARARIYDRSGNLVVDTATLLQRGKGTVARPEPRSDAERPRTRNFWTRITAFLIDGELPVYKEIGSANGNAYPEVRAALQGESNAVLLLDDDGEQIVAIAEPIRRAKSKNVQGVLFLSTRPGAISGIINEERQVILTLAVFALLAMLTSSWLLARTVAEPMKQLSEAAYQVSRSISARAELPDDPQRRDEVGQMASSFRAMTAALYRRIEASEKFAADVAHELKNPLAAARSTAESLSYAKNDEQREQLVQQIQFELKRLNRLINDVSNASRLDAELARQKMKPVDLRLVLEQVRSIFSDKLSDTSRRIVLDVAPGLGLTDTVIDGHDGRLGQVATNLIDNALSFTPENGAVIVAVDRIRDLVVMTVSDQGPGIPSDKLDAIFDRFYSDRPETDQSRGKNSGLGLSISREIVVAHGGRIFAENLYPPPANSQDVGDSAPKIELKPNGARFTVEFPKLRTAGGPARRAVG